MYNVSLIYRNENVFVYYSLSANKF